MRSTMDPFPGHRLCCRVVRGSGVYKRRLAFEILKMYHFYNLINLSKHKHLVFIVRAKVDILSQAFQPSSRFQSGDILSPSLISLVAGKSSFSKVLLLYKLFLYSHFILGDQILRHQIFAAFPSLPCSFSSELISSRLKCQKYLMRPGLLYFMFTMEFPKQWVWFSINFFLMWAKCCFFPYKLLFWKIFWHIEYSNKAQINPFLNIYPLQLHTG